MMLDTLDNISGLSQLLQHLLRLLLEKGATNYPASSCCPLKLEMQRANAKTQDDYANYMAESIQLSARRYLDEP